MAKNIFKSEAAIKEEVVTPASDRPVVPKKIAKMADFFTPVSKEQVTKWLPFIMFMSFLAFIYITNSYYAEKNIRKIDKISQELKELRSEYITTKSELMFKSNQSEIAHQLENYGVKESTVPPKKIMIKKREKIY
jgi:hypothetical protein